MHVLNVRRQSILIWHRFPHYCLRAHGTVEGNTNDPNKRNPLNRNLLTGYILFHAVNLKLGIQELSSSFVVDLYIRPVALQSCGNLHHPLHLKSQANQKKVKVKASEARTYVQAVLVGNNVSQDNAAIIADCLIQADLRGVDTHGVNRIPSYMARIRQGVLNPRATPTLQKLTPVVAQVDGHNAFGFLAAHLGMANAIEMAQEFGIGMVSIKHSNHFGMSAWVVQQAIDAGMMSLVFTNSSPALPVWGGKSKLMGVSPIACGAPGGRKKPFILDMAPSIAARGKIYKAYRRGEKIPRDWALDAEGRPTDEPAKALDGVMLPMGGPKGSALSVMMDVFSGVLSGSAFAGHVTNPYDPSKPADVGHFLIAIKPDLFMNLEEFKERMDYLYRRVVESDKMAGVDRIYFPGEIEQLTQEERLHSGIPYVEAEIAALNEEAELVRADNIIVSS